MHELAQAFLSALDMLLHFDAELYGIIVRSMQVSLSALGIALLLGLAAASALTLYEFPGKHVIIVLLHTLLSLPPVVVGLMVYLLFSFNGLFGSLGWLFTPAAMIVAQVTLVFPIIAAYGHDILRAAWHEYQDQLTSLGARKPQSALILIRDCRYALVLIALGGFGRAISEVGAVMIVGGNILHHTRVMTTSITLATSRGELGVALALGCILLLLALGINILGFLLRQRSSQ
ncbi:MAG: ABC transporter permease [Alphaproteobacteria bacterium]|nr:ABC transporter permease [Alphaproteobacteria bacterium]